MEYAVVDKSKRKVSQEENNPVTEYDDSLVENKMTQVSIDNFKQLTKGLVYQPGYLSNRDHVKSITITMSITIYIHLYRSSMQNYKIYLQIQEAMMLIKMVL